MVYLYNIQNPMVAHSLKVMESNTKEAKKHLNDQQPKKSISTTKTLQQLTRANKAFLFSLGFKLKNN